ncbi:hypothetical protein MCOR25_010940 [Pyricularia grisea]|nr:hypothetical protein MCOR25_010940 [Pyricularia grisea]
MAEVDGEDANYDFRGIEELPEPLERSLKISGERRPMVDYKEHQVYRSKLPSLFHAPKNNREHSIRTDDPDHVGNRIWTDIVEVQFSQGILVFETDTVWWICHSWPQWRGHDCPTGGDVSCFEHMTEIYAHFCHQLARLPYVHAIFVGHNRPGRP